MKAQIDYIESLETSGFRNYRMELNEVYFWTDTIKDWKRLLNYIHLNPLQEKWNLVELPEYYRWSSAKFYDTGEDEFGILTHYLDRFG